MDLRGATILATRIDEKLHHMLLSQLMSSVKRLRGNWGEKFQPELTLVVDLFYQIFKFDILRESPGLNAMSLSLCPDARSQTWLVFRKFILILLLGTGYAYRRLSKIRGANQQIMYDVNTPAATTTPVSIPTNNNVSLSSSTTIESDNNNHDEESIFYRITSLPAVLYRNSLSSMSLFYSNSNFQSIINTGAKVVKVIDLINTLTFFLEGRYPTLLHRILGESLTTHVSKGGPTTRRVSPALAYVIGRQITLIAISELIRVGRESTHWNSIKRFLGAWFLLQWRRTTSAFAHTFSQMFNYNSGRNSNRSHIPDQTMSSNARNITTSTARDRNQTNNNNDGDVNNDESNVRQTNASTGNGMCSTCQRRIENPHTSDCGHVHCYYCLSGALATARMINTYHRCASCGSYNQSCIPFHDGAS